MIRNTMLAATLFTFTAGSAMAATGAHTSHRRSHKVAQTTDAPATGDVAKDGAKKGKKAHKNRKVKAESAAKGDMPAAPTPAPAPTPTPAPAK